MSTVATRPAFVIRGWHVLVALVLFFGTVIAVDSVFISLALRTNSGQVAANPYEAGLAFNRTLKQRADQAALGWTATLQDTADGRLSAVITDRDGGALDALQVEARLERPATEKGRMTVALTPVGEGRYAAPADLHGAWDVTLTATGPDGERFEAVRRLVRP